MNDILKYQSLDMELKKIKRTSEESDERHTMTKMSGYVKDAQNKSLQLESRAKLLINEYNETKKLYNSNYKKIQELVKQDSSNLSLDEIAKIMDQVNKVTGVLYQVEKNLTQLNEKIKAILKDFETARNTAVKAREQYKNAKQKYDSNLNVISPKIEEILEQQKKLEKVIDKDLFAKYVSLKHDNIFPVFVKLDGKLCGRCRIELPSKELDKLKNAKYIVCEHCGSLIYNENV